VSYLLFVYVLVLPPVAVLAGALAADRRADPAVRRDGPVALAGFTAVALVWTIPWDRWVIGNGLWSYPGGRVRAWWWGVPAEEYAFIVLQACGAGLWTCLVAGRRRRRWPVAAGGRRVHARLLAGGGWAAVTVAAIAVVATGPDEGFYLAALVAWCGVPAALQRLVGADVLRAERTTRALAVLPPVAYLCAVDRWALADGIWVISPGLTVGPRPMGIPVEEVAFFLVTVSLLVDGLLLSLHPAVRARLPRPAAAPGPGVRGDGDVREGGTG
jgi:lycopene cyclase domain-containing protein